jgi:hypothetical protein
LLLCSGGSGSKKKRSSTSTSDASTPVSDASTPVSDNSPLEDRIDCLSIQDDDRKGSGNDDLNDRLGLKFGLDDFVSVVSTVVQADNFASTNSDLVGTGKEEVGLPIQRRSETNEKRMLDENKELKEQVSMLLSKVKEQQQPKPKNNGQFGNMVDRKKRLLLDPNDVFGTPLWVINSVLKIYGGRIERSKTILDPFDGEGTITTYLNSKDFTTEGRDIRITNGRTVSMDFFAHLPCKGEGYSYIFCNPPFISKAEIWKALIESELPYCMLAPMDTISLVSMQPILKTHGFSVIVLSPRPRFTRLNGKDICIGACVWICGNWGDEVAGVMSGAIDTKDSSITSPVEEEEEEEEEDEGFFCEVCSMRDDISVL